MKRAWIENDVIYLTDNPNLKINGEYIEIPDDASIVDVEIVDGKPQLKSEEKRLQYLKDVKIMELKNYVNRYLSRTDWVTIKLISMANEGYTDEEIEIERQKKSSILEERRRIREWYKTKKQEILNETDISRLRTLSLSPFVDIDIDIEN